MFKKIFIFALFLFVTGLIYKKASTCCSKNRLIEKKPFYLINVLDQEEFLDAHIDQSVHVPFEEVASFLNSIEDKKIPLIFYCANYFCTSSDEAALLAIKKGFTDVSVYQGGIAEWYQASQRDSSFIVNGPAEAEYLKIVIFPNNEKNTIEEENKLNKQKNIKKILIKDLQKILKKDILK
jgi:rhodanese-related sulfurtransferase